MEVLFNAQRGGTAASFSNLDERYCSAEVDSHHLGGYVGGMAGPLALRADGLWTWNGIETSRAVLSPNLYDRQRSDYDAATDQVSGEIANPTQMASVELESFTGLAYLSVDSDGIREHGGPQVSLWGLSYDQDVGYMTVGLHAATTVT